jgi:tRNA(Ile)-lysidine synthase
MRKPPPFVLSLDTTLLQPGLRLAVGLSGGADSVALLCSLAARRAELGLVLHAAHLHHGLRGAEADGDLEFARSLANDLGLRFHEACVDTKREIEKTRESTEEAARRLRYGWFRQLMADGTVDAVATAHTRNDQAETVLAKFLRGAWTEGLSGIHPVVEFAEGQILRPLLTASRAEVEAYLKALGQSWREDSSNADPAYTRNRIRHQLLPLLESWNPQLCEHLAQMAQLARDEESWWAAELARLEPKIRLEGRPVRGGGRAAAEGLALDLTKLAELAPAAQRRLLRSVAGQLGAAPDFAATEALRALAQSGRAGQKCELAQGLRAERTHRELRLGLAAQAGLATQAEIADKPDAAGRIDLSVEIPGEIAAPEFGICLRIETTATPTEPRIATLRNWRPGDRVRLRYSSGPRKVKEVLERLRISGSERSHWPVLEVDGKIVWMKGVELEPESDVTVVAE